MDTKKQKVLSIIDYICIGVLGVGVISLFLNVFHMMNSSYHSQTTTDVVLSREYALILKNILLFVALIMLVSVIVYLIKIVCIKLNKSEKIVSVISMIVTAVMIAALVAGIVLAFTNLPKSYPKASDSNYEVFRYNVMDYNTCMEVQSSLFFYIIVAGIIGICSFMQFDAFFNVKKWIKAIGISFAIILVVCFAGFGLFTEYGAKDNSKDNITYYVTYYNNNQEYGVTIINKQEDFDNTIVKVYYTVDGVDGVAEKTISSFEKNESITLSAIEAEVGELKIKYCTIEANNLTEKHIEELGEQDFNDYSTPFFVVAVVSSVVVLGMSVLYIISICKNKKREDLREEIV